MKANGKPRRWTKRDDELLCVQGISVDELAEVLDRTPCELWARAGELEITLRNDEPQEPDFKPAASEPPPIDTADLVQLGSTPQPLGSLLVDRSSQAMDADGAERVARRVALALYRGSIEVARSALEDGWSAHTGDGPLPQGPSLLVLPLTRAVPDLRVLNAVEALGIQTIGEFVERGRYLLEETVIPQIGEKTKQRMLDLIRELRVRADLDKPAAPEPSADALSPTSAESRARGRRKRIPAVADASPEMRQFCEAETVRLLPLIEQIARSTKLPLPMEDLIQEGASACYEALPRYNPNLHQTSEGKPVRIETFVTARIRGAMLDYARRVGYLTHGGARTGRQEVVLSLTAPTRSSESDHSGRTATVGDFISDPSAEEPGLAIATQSAWKDVLRGFDQRERILVLEYFVHGRTLKSIGGDLALSESRCSQMLTQIIGRLRESDRVGGGRVRELLA